jgi:UDPglucose 6-dehydrogenase
MNLAVIGLGKLGLPLAALLATSGNQVKAFDALDSVRTNIRQRKVETNEPGLINLLNKDSIQLEIVDSIAESVDGVEAVFIIVPTPSLPSGHFTNEYLLDAINKIGQAIAPSQKIVIDVVSTVMPGSCDGAIKSALEKSSGRNVGEELGLCYNPEFIALGSVIHDMENPDMHLIGQSSEWAGEVVENALKSIVKVQVPSRRMNLKEAELVKIAVNNYVTMKISYANMLMQGATLLGGIDIDVVTDAIGLDSRIGRKYLKAAAAYGGPCFPRDTRALSALFSDLGLPDSLSQATQVVNESHTEFISDQISKQISDGMTVGIAGLSYKTGTTVTEESPGLALANVLSNRSFRVAVWDDEGALPSSESTSNSYLVCHSAEDLISKSDFIVITRPLNNLSTFASQLKESNKPFIDLWRQF